MGRLRLSEGSEQLSKIIIIGLMDGSNANPFNVVGGAQDVIFNVNDQAVRSRITLKIRQLFRRLEMEERARLAPGWPIFHTEEGTGELVATIQYFDMESAMDEELSINFAAALAGGDITQTRIGG